MSLKPFIGILSAIWLIAQSLAIAAPAPMELKHKVSLAQFRGSPFLTAMTDEKDGIKANLDEDFTTTYTIADADDVVAALNNFDKKVVGKTLSSFPDGEKGLRKLAESLAGKKFTPSNVVGVVKSKYKGSGNIFSLAQLFAMASGAGTLVTINKDNYYYNYGYKAGDPKTVEDDVKSGRSFGAGPKHNANDASDVFYLRELESFLSSTKDPKDFYTAIIEVLTQCETSGYKELSPEGQTVATDFLAIYTAESDRHLMVKLAPNNHPWENDLAEVTFVALFSASAGKVMNGGKLQDGKLENWWAMNADSGRSGIGKTRKDRRQLQKLITDYERKKHPAYVTAVEKALGAQQTDLFQGMMEFLNSTKTQKAVAKSSSELSKSFVDFLMQVHRDSNEMATNLN